MTSETIARLHVSRSWKLEAQTILCSFVLLCLGFVVLYPLILLLVNSFQLDRPGQEAVYSLENWRIAFSRPTMWEAVANTFSLTAVRVLVSMVVATLVAWVLARTDVFGREWLELGFWVAYFLPTLPVVLAWILLLDPKFGLINTAIAQVTGASQGPFNIYSWWGIVWAHLVTNTIAIKVMLLVPSFRNMDSALEEASLTCGVSHLGTLLRIMLPIMVPVLSVVALMSSIRGLEAFEIELILGLPERIDVYSTQIYRLVHREPPEYGQATALGVMILALMVPFVSLQQWLSGRRRYTTVSAHSRTGLIRLGAWRWPVFFSILALVALLTVVPFIFLLMSTLMRLFGFFEIADPWTLKHWTRVLGDPLFLESVKNTVLIGLGTAVASALVYSIIAYIVVRTRYAGRAALNFLSWLPFALPGILLSLGFLWMFLGVPVFRPLYGTHLVLILALTLSSMTLGVQLCKSTLLQIGNELEEASSVSGAPWWYTYRRVLLPLLGPTLIVVGVIAFVNATRNVSTVVLLASSSTRPLSLLQLDYMIEGRYEAAGVVGLVVVGLTLCVTLAARRLGLSLAADGASEARNRD